ncbi:MAG: hypothetical protein FWE06_02045 [Oscillospiraceae bacterium]|nr:hypothetical protein [Oscillospiraceae bacterium]
MTYIEAITRAKLTDLPESYATLWEGFTPSPRGVLWRDEELLEHQELFAFNDELTATILHVKATIEADETLHTLAQFVHWSIFVRTKPFLAERPNSVTPQAMGDDKGLFAMVILIAEAFRTLPVIAQYKLDYDRITGNFKSLNNGAHEYKKEHGHWGLNSFHWNCNCVVPYMNRCGHLTFEPVSYDNPYSAYVHKVTGEILVLADDNVGCTADGLLTSHNCPFPEAFKTTVRQEGKYTIAHKIDPLGFIECEPSRHNLSEYELAFKQWDVLLAFHIPSGPGYTVDACADSFKKAVKFFNETFPDIDIKGICCYSWLYTPQLRLILSPEESEMVRIQEHCYQVPAWRDSGAYNRFVFKVDGKLNEIELPQNSRLHRRLAAVVNRGGYLTSGGMVLPLAAIDKWKDTVYDSGASLETYVKAQPHDCGDLRDL